VRASLSVVAASPARAYQGLYDGNKLLQTCQASDFSSKGVCLGYVVGVADAMEGAQFEGGTVLGSRACFPAYMTALQAKDVAVMFLTSHPEWRHFGASGLVAGALASAFPCPA